MKKLFQILFYLIISFTALSQEQKDNATINSKKQRFISIDVGSGAGWRKYNNINDTMVVILPEKGESPGLSYAFRLNYGFIKKGGLMHLG